MTRTPFRLFASVSVIAALAACGDTPPTASAPDESVAARAAASQDRVEALFQLSSPHVMAIPGTVFADNDETIGKLVFGVEHLGVVRSVENTLTRLGIAKSDYDVILTEPIYFAATLRDRFRPTVAGIQLHFSQYVCTLGFNVDHGGGRSFITNSHCTAKQGGTEGTLYYQPSSSADPNAIAIEVDDPVYVRGGTCPKGKTCRHSDAARALYYDATASNRGEIAQTTGVNNGSLTVSSTSPIFTITSQDNSTKSFSIGMAVNKVGRTTGWTRGEVTRTCVNTSVSGSTVYLYCQSFVSDPGGATVVGGGDSGSGVFSVTSGSSVKLVGILWGGSRDNKSFVFSPLASIQQELGSVNAVK
jgi:hypothetical protein